MGNFATHYGKDQRKFQSATIPNRQFSVDRVSDKVLFKIHDQDSYNRGIAISHLDTIKTCIVALRLMGTAERDALKGGEPAHQAHLSQALAHLRQAAALLEIEQDPRVEALAKAIWDEGDDAIEWEEAPGAQPRYRARARSLIQAMDSATQKDPQ